MTDRAKAHSQLFACHCLPQSRRKTSKNKSINNINREKRKGEKTSDIESNISDVLRWSCSAQGNKLGENVKSLATHHTNKQTTDTRTNSSKTGTFPCNSNKNQARENITTNLQLPLSAKNRMKLSFQHFINILPYTHFSLKSSSALANSTQWVECWPSDQRVSGFIPGPH